MLEGKLLRIRLCRPPAEKAEIATMLALDGSGLLSPHINTCCHQGCPNQRSGVEFALAYMWPVEALVEVPPWSEPVRVYHYACSELCGSLFALSFWEPPQDEEKKVEAWQH